MSGIYDFDTFYKDASPVKFDLTYNRSHDPMDIVKGYIDAVGRGKRKLPPPQSAFSGIIEREIVSVNAKIITVMRRLWKGRRVRYSELFSAVGGRGELVATFLAVLELVKGKRVRIDGDGDNAQVYMLEDKK
jgi:segregation and condensation protein A